MLVLGRKVGERIRIGDDIVVTVVSTRKDGARIGIEAPGHVRVHRAEIVDAVAEDNRAAAAAADSTADQLRKLLGNQAA